MSKLQISLAAARVNAEMTQTEAAKAMSVSKILWLIGKREHQNPLLHKRKNWR